MASLAVVFALAVLSGAACTSRVSRALDHEVGSPVAAMIADLGAPDADRAYTDERRLAGFCPAATTRLVEYHRKPLMPWVDDGAEAIVCVDGRGVIIAMSSTSPW